LDLIPFKDQRDSVKCGDQTGKLESRGSLFRNAVNGHR